MLKNGQTYFKIFKEYLVIYSILYMKESKLLKTKLAFGVISRHKTESFSLILFFITVDETK